MPTIYVKEETYRKLLSLLSKLQEEKGRKMSFTEIIEVLIKNFSLARNWTRTVGSLKGREGSKT